MVVAQKSNNDNNLNTEGVLVKTSRIAQHGNTITLDRWMGECHRKITLKHK
jgi:hypothetical protein